MFTIHPKKDLPDSLKKKLQVAIVFSNWHTDVVQLLLSGATKACQEKGISEEQIHYYSAPGAYELPQLVEHLARTKKFSVIVPLGCVIRGETNHYDLIVETISKAFDQIGRSYHLPVSFGVLTVENLAQALERAGGNKGNKGAEAVHAALELAAEFERVQ